ncbi:MAG: ATP-binding protein [Phormidesmis sp.]
MLTSDFISQTKAALEEITQSDISTAMVDVTNCDREPIHTPAAIQPHGVLLVLNDQWTISKVSSNTQKILGFAPQALLGQSLFELFQDKYVRQIKACLQEDFDAVSPLQLESRARLPLTGVVHRSGEYILLELEPTPTFERTSFFDFYGFVKKPVGRFQKAQTLNELCQAAVEEIQKISNFDRVMVYRFDKDGSGTVIAETVRDPKMAPYLGLRYPHTDIPQQAKYLYLLNRVRLIPDVTYDPVPLVSIAEAQHADGNATDGNEADGNETAPLDMSFSTLRSVSPLHTEYMQNMGVRASMSISLVQDNQLWGLIACHHRTPQTLSYERRTLCEFLGQAIAMELTTKEGNENSAYKLALKALQTDFIATLARSSTLEAGLTQDPRRLAAITGSSGVAFCYHNNLTLLGDTPKEHEVQALLAWVEQQFNQQSEKGVLYQTAALSETYPAAAEFDSPIGGLLALAVSQIQNIYVLWFRPEVLQTVKWAGDPNKPIDIDANGLRSLSPRRSFALWKEQVEGRSLPWKTCEIAAAIELRSAIIGVVLRQADELAQLNSELSRSNIELDSFAYIASHDLKEPLRGIHNYASFLIEDYSDLLDQDGIDKLNTLTRLTQRMEELINSLLHYSRLGRSELVLNEVNLNEVVTSAIDVIKVSKPNEARFEVPQSLPTIQCDRTQIAELFTNLITNGIKYNDKADKMIEIGSLSPRQAREQAVLPKGEELLINSTVYYVKDNGIGIRDKHLATVFRIFKRLHGPKRFGGGTGAGLTIAKKIVERHGGLIWIQSIYEEGSTFYFTLKSGE